MSEQNALKRGFEWPSIRHLKRKPREINRLGRGAEVASVKRNGGRRKELQKAEYRNRKKGMVTGRTEEEICTVGTAARGKREEGKRKSGRLSSQNRAKKWTKESLSAGKARKRKHKGSTGGTAVGAKPGRTKGN